MIPSVPVHDEGAAVRAVMERLHGSAAQVFVRSLRAKERAGDSEDDRGAQVIARLFVSGALAALNRPEDSDRAISEALRRAEGSGSPMNIGAAVISTASNHLSRRAGPDFTTSNEIFDEGRL